MKCILWLLLWQIVGLTCAYHAGPFDWKAVSCVVITLGSVFFILGKRQALYAASGCLMICASALAFIAVESPNNQTYSPHSMKQTNGAKLVLLGKVRGNTSHRLELDVRRINHFGKSRPTKEMILVSSYHPLPRYQQGAVVSCWVKLRQPDQFETPGSFKRRLFLAGKSIYTEATLANTGDCTLLSEPNDAIASIRERIRALIIANTPASTHGPLLAMLLADKYELDSSSRTLFQRTGIYHLLVISGFHLSLIFGLSFTACRWLFSFFPTACLWLGLNRMASMAALIPLGFYFALIDPGTPACRAMACILLLVLCHVAGAKPRPFCFLASAAILILMLKPAALFFPSFQLTFVCTLSILLACRYLIQRPIYRQSPWLVRSALALLVASTAAFFASLPIVATHFHGAATYSILTNLIATPIVACFVLPAGMLASFVAMLLPDLSTILFALSGFFLDGLLSVMQWVASLPSAHLPLPIPNAIELGAAIYLFAFLCNELTFAKRRAIGLCFVALLLPTLFHTFYAYARQSVAIDFLDVGQGDATLIRAPQGIRILVDTGTEKATRQSVEAALRYHRVHHIDALVLTHNNADHIGGALHLFERFRISEVWIPADFHSASFHLPSKVRVRRLHRRSSPMYTGPLRWTVLNPLAEHLGHPDEELELSSNDSSLVLALQYRKFRALFTADVEKHGERHLRNETTQLTCDLLKVPHHGSRTSSTLPFLKAASPRYAIASAGRNHPFGHPHQQVVDRYRSLQIPLLTTAQHGTITVRTNGNHIRLRPYI